MPNCGVACGAGDKAHSDHDDGAGHEAHHIVDGKACIHIAARGVDEDLHRVVALGFKHQEVLDELVCAVLVDFSGKENGSGLEYLLIEAVFGLLLLQVVFLTVMQWIKWFR